MGNTLICSSGSSNPSNFNKSNIINSTSSVNSNIYHNNPHALKAITKLFNAVANNKLNELHLLCSRYPEYIHAIVPVNNTIDIQQQLDNANNNIKQHNHAQLLFKSNTNKSNHNNHLIYNNPDLNNSKIDESNKILSKYSNRVNYLYELDMPINLLVLASWCGYIKIIEYLLKLGLDPNPTNYVTINTTSTTTTSNSNNIIKSRYNNRTPSHSNKQLKPLTNITNTHTPNTSKLGNEKELQPLLNNAPNNNNNPNTIKPRNNNNNSAICSALTSVILSTRPMRNREYIIKLLLSSNLIKPEYRVNNSKIINNLNSFEASCFIENYTIARILLNYNNNLIDYVDEYGNNLSLLNALKHNKENTVKFLLQNNIKLNPIIYTQINNNINNNLLVVNNNNNNNTHTKSLLEYALSQGCVSLVKSLFEHCAVHEFQWHTQYLNHLNLIEYLVSSGIEPPNIKLINIYISSVCDNIIYYPRIFTNIRNAISNGYENLTKRLYTVYELLNSHNLPTSIILNYAYNNINDTKVINICSLCKNLLSQPCPYCINNNWIKQCIIKTNENNENNNCCNHTFHLHCIRTYYNTNKYPVKCPANNCNQYWQFASMKTNNNYNNNYIDINNDNNSIVTRHKHPHYLFNDEKEEKEGKIDDSDKFVSPIDLSPLSPDDKDKRTISAPPTTTDSDTNNNMIRIGAVLLKRVTSLDIPIQSTIDIETADALIAALEAEELLEQNDKIKTNTNIDNNTIDNNTIDNTTIDNHKDRNNNLSVTIAVANNIDNPSNNSNNSNAQFTPTPSPKPKPEENTNDTSSPPNTANNTDSTAVAPITTLPTTSTTPITNNTTAAISHTSISKPPLGIASVNIVIREDSSSKSNSTNINTTINTSTVLVTNNNMDLDSHDLDQEWKGKFIQHEIVE